MPTEFERALAKVLVHEGGYVNHPKDPGGPTNKGITQRVYDAYRRANVGSTRTVQSITPDEVEAIYRSRYWDVIKGDELPAGVGYVVFDGAVNSGVGRSPKWLQRALSEAGLYKGAIDGVIGPGTIEATHEHPNHDQLIARICEIRLAFLKALVTWPTFCRGWASRVAGVKSVGQAWATGGVAPMLHFVDGGQAKALDSSAKKAPSAAPGDVAATGGGFTVALTQAREQLEPLAAVPHIQTVLAWLAIAGLVATVGGVAYRFYAKRKAAQLKEALS